jgi:MtN3 and saliva related transmembrane protein
MQALALVTVFWAVVMALSPMLQVRRMLHSRSSGMVSTGYFTLICIGFTLWILYGISKKNPVLIVPNSLALIVGVLTIGVARRYRKSPDRSPSESI